jgi:energy-coupling factor transport system permease protein
MYPLKLIKFPTHEIAMTISIALRFIPTLLDETMRIMNAQASRGVDFEHGKVKEKIKAILSLIVPLFMSAFQRSEELANAMEARGYNPRAKRTRYRNLHWGISDTLSLIFVITITTGVIVTSVMNWNFIEMIFNIPTWVVIL